MTKGEKAHKRLVASAGASLPAQKQDWQQDMSSHSSVLAFGHRMKGLSRLDAFLANAGIDVTHWETFEGTESTVAVNVISTFLVAMLAIPKLRETSAAQKQSSHLVFTGSVLHVLAKHKYLSQPRPGTIFNTLNDESLADMGNRYPLSKLLVLLCVEKLAQKLGNGLDNRRASIIVNYVNPGWCKTQLFRTNDGGVGGRLGLALIGRTAEEGSRTLVHGAMADADSHGKYLSECRIKPESSFVRSDAAAAVRESVWSELSHILESIAPGVTNI